jgi:uncharacterized membrane protein
VVEGLDSNRLRSLLARAWATAAIAGLEASADIMQRSRSDFCWEPSTVSMLMGAKSQY